MVMDSHCVGFTLPGMMDEPGSFSGIKISPNPSRGPLASQRTSFAIFIRLQASAFIAPCANTIASLEVSAWNLLEEVTKSLPVITLTCLATSTSNPTGALSPVPTAVPPSASSFRLGNVSAICALVLSIIARQPLISCENAMGTASCKCVRPLLTMPLFSSSRRASVALNLSNAGKR